MDLSWISGHWEQLGSIVGVIVWIIRLEGKVLSSEKRITTAERAVEHVEQRNIEADKRITQIESQNVTSERRLTHMEGQVENIESGLTKELSDVKQSLARIEGYLKAKSEEQGNGPRNA